MNVPSVSVAKVNIINVKQTIKSCKHFFFHFQAPFDFYSKVWTILERSLDGFVIDGHHLHQQPTLSDMSEFFTS